MGRFWCDYLAEKLRELRPEADEEMSLGEKEEAQEALDFVDRMTAYLVTHMVGFSDLTAGRIESLFRQVGAPVDEQIEHYFVRDMLKRVPKIVARTLKLSHIVPSKTVLGATEIYLREATRTYLFGFWDGSVALSRAAIEQGIREAIESQVGHSPATLRELVEASLRWRLLDKANADLADKVVRTGNRVLHNDPADEAEAWDVLCSARGVLLHLFNSH